MNRIKEVLDKKDIKKTWFTEQLGKSYNIVNAYEQNRHHHELKCIIKPLKFVAYT